MMPDLGEIAFDQPQSRLISFCLKKRNNSYRGPVRANNNFANA